MNINSNMLHSLHDELSQKLNSLMRCILTTRDSLTRITSRKKMEKCQDLKVIALNPTKQKIKKESLILKRSPNKKRMNSRKCSGLNRNQTQSKSKRRNIKKYKKKNPYKDKLRCNPLEIKDNNSEEEEEPPKTQIPINQFWASCYPYFRPVADRDLEYLDKIEDSVAPYIVPPVGKRLENEDKTNSKFLKPLSERVISSLIEEYILSHPLEKPQPKKPAFRGTAKRVSKNLNTNLAELEERLYCELKHIGLIGSDSDDKDNEIIKELCELQVQLKCQVAINNAHRKKLKEVALKWMARQELDALINENYKNIERAYFKRFKTSKCSKKKKTPPDFYPSEEAVAGYLRDRDLLVKEVSVFFRPETLMIAPSASQK